MLLKSFGVILLLSASLYLCFAFATFERRRMMQCEGFLQLMRHIKAQITCFRMPLSRIWTSFSSDELERCGFLSALRECQDVEKALMLSKENIWISADELHLLRSFSGELGRSYADEQIACCEYYIEELERMCAERKNAGPMRTKLYRSLFLVGGMMLVIILI